MSKRQPAMIYKKEVLKPRDLSDLLNPLHQHHYLHHHHRHLLPPPPPAAAALQVSGRSTGRQRRDKENARVLGLSLDTVQMVAALPMEEFNEVARGYRGEQKKILRDMRKRWRNKGAAQKCRKKKLEEIEELEKKKKKYQEKCERNKMKEKSLRRERDTHIETARQLITKIKERGGEILCSMHKFTEICLINCDL